MNQEQESYISLIKQTSKETIRIKKTGWEEIKLPGHAHESARLSIPFPARCMYR